jgi:cell wall-associated NlpC family hydrolase
MLFLWPANALADSGGISTDPTAPPPSGTTTPTTGYCPGGGVGSTTSCGPTGTATLLSTGLAVAPADAPRAVRRAIRYANMIVVGKPYRLGGGHRLPWVLDSAYDCSGTVSWALHGARLLRSPVPSGGFARWGAPGPGRWISVYYNGGHAFMTIAGLRLDTSMTAGIGPGWSTKMVSTAGYEVRHAPGL